MDHCGGEKVDHWGVDEKELVRLPVGVDLEQLWSELRVFRFFRDLGSNALSAVAWPVAVAVHLQDVNVVGEPVQQCSGEPLRAEDLGPFVDGQVGGDQDGAPFGALAEGVTRGEQVLYQLVSIGAPWGWSFVATGAILLAIKYTMGLRVGSRDEEVGLDVSQHDEVAYILDDN